MLADNEFSAVTAANPFSAEVSEPKFMHIWFVQESAGNANTERLDEIASAGERFQLTDSAFYLHVQPPLAQNLRCI